MYVQEKREKDGRGAARPDPFKQQRPLSLPLAIRCAALSDLSDLSYADKMPDPWGV